MSTDVFEPVMPLAELPVGRMRAHVIAGREIVICRTNEGVFALDNICTHAYARMSEGKLRRTRLICPLHGASYDVCTGRALSAPAIQPLVTHQARINNGTIEVSVSSSAPPPLSAD